MDKEVFENYKRYLERLEYFRSFGYDLEKERDFILDKSLPVGGEILEIGTGKGHFALALAKRGYKFISIDISAQEQEAARLNLRYFGLEQQVSLRIEDAEKLNFPDQSFDAIFSINVFHHLKNPFIVLDEIIRLLAPRGKIVLGDFTREGLELMDKLHAQEGRRHEKSRFDLSHINEYLEKKGFKYEQYRTELQEVLVCSKI